MVKFTVRIIQSPYASASTIYEQYPSKTGFTDRESDKRGAALQPKFCKRIDSVTSGYQKRADRPRDTIIYTAIFTGAYV